MLLVARTTLGTINHTLLSLAALRAAGLNVRGVVMVGKPNVGKPQRNRALRTNQSGRRTFLALKTLNRATLLERVSQNISTRESFHT